MTPDIAATYMALPTTPSTARITGLIEKFISFNIPIIMRAITKDVKIEPEIYFMKFDLM